VKNSEWHVVIFPRGQLTAKDKERFTKAGVLAAEADDPSAVCQMHLTRPMVSTKISGDAIVQAALEALCFGADATGSLDTITYSARQRSEFVRLLSKSLAA